MTTATPPNTPVQSNSAEKETPAKSEKQPEKAVPDRATITNALRLGWLLAEIFGLIRDGALQHIDSTVVLAQPPAPRFTISDRPKSSKSRLLLSDLHLLREIALAIKMWPDEKNDPDNPMLALYEQCLQLLSQRRRAGAPSELDVFKVLEGWSLDIGSQLHAQHELYGRTFSYGASMADTYWYMKEPPKPGNPDSRRSREKWKALLNQYRMHAMGERILEMEPYLDPHVAQALYHSLHNWAVDERVEKLGQAFDQSAEMGLVSDLRRQMWRWRDIVLGVRLPTGYLKKRDRLVARLVQFGLTLATTIILTIFVAGIIYLVAGFLTQTLFPSLWNTVLDLQATGTEPTLSLKDILGTFTIWVAVLGALWQSGRWIMVQIRNAHAYFGRIAIDFFVRRRTYHAWRLNK